MKKPEPHIVRSHEDPVLFREALNFTAAETGFVSRLIEKQLETELKPVLRSRDFVEFDLERAIRTVSEMAGFLA